MDFLLDEFVAHLEPVYEQYRGQQGENLERFLVNRDRQVADQLLGITDKHARKTGNPGVKKAYEKLRPQAQNHVAEAIPPRGENAHQLHQRLIHDCAAYT